MHAAKIPFTGLMVSSLAVTCIILIAYYAPGKANIIKATVIVAIFKLMLSPHSPPSAYIAVFFQGYLGQLLFHGRRHFTLSAISLSVLSLVESAIQRLLLLFIIYGNTFWHAVDQYISKTVGGADRHYSSLLALGYIFLHAIAGIFVGIFAVGAVRDADKWNLNNPSFLFSHSIPAYSEIQSRLRKKKYAVLFIFLWVVLLILFVQVYTDPLHTILPKNDVSLIFFRSLLILMSGDLFFAPLIRKLIRQKLESQKNKKQTEVNKIMKLLPQTKYIFIQSWLLSNAENGIKRIRLFLKILLINILSDGKETINTGKEELLTDHNAY